jgi:hypothetical protein
MEVFNFPNHPSVSGREDDITDPNFGRIVTKTRDRRDVQLAIQYQF